MEVALLSQSASLARVGQPDKAAVPSPSIPIAAEDFGPQKFVCREEVWAYDIDRLDVHILIWFMVLMPNRCPKRTRATALSVTLNRCMASALSKLFVQINVKSPEGPRPSSNQGS